MAGNASCVRIEEHIDDEHGMACSDALIEPYEHPRNIGSFMADDDASGTGRAGAPAALPPLPESD